MKEELELLNDQQKIELVKHSIRLNQLNDQQLMANNHNPRIGKIKKGEPAVL